MRRERSVIYALLAAIAGCTAVFDGDGNIKVTPDCSGIACPDVTPDDPAPVSTLGTTGTSVALEPSVIVLPRGGRTDITATISLEGDPAPTDNGILWLPTGGAVTQKGPASTSGSISTYLAAYTAPSVAGTYYLVARSIGDPTAQAVTKIVVKQVWLEISPPGTTVLPGKTAQFSAIVSGTDDVRVAWSISQGSSASNGSIDASGLYRAPLQAFNGNEFVTIRATSVADPAVSVTVPVWVKITDVKEVTVHPAETRLEVGDQLLFHAEVNASDKNFTWTIEPIEGEDTGGAFVSMTAKKDRAILVAGLSPGRFRVRATHSEPGAGVSFGTAIVEVTEPPFPPLRGLVRAGPGVTVGAMDPIIVSGIWVGFGATSRDGLGFYKIRGWGDFEWPQKVIAWKDSGTGLLRPTQDPWALLTLEGPPGEMFQNLTLEAHPMSPATLENADSPPAPDVHVLSGPSQSKYTLAVSVPPFKESGTIPGLTEGEEEALDFDSVDKYVVELSAGGETFVPVQNRELDASSSMRVVFFQDVAAGTYKVRYRGSRTVGSTTGTTPNSDEATVSAATPSNSRTVTFKVDLRGLVIPANARAYVFVESNSGGPDRGVVLPYPLETTEEVSVTDSMPDGSYSASLLIDEQGDHSFSRGDRIWLRARHFLVAGTDTYTVSLKPAAARAKVDLIAMRSGQKLELFVLASPFGHPLLSAAIVDAPPGVTPPGSFPLDLRVAPIGSLRYAEAALSLAALPHGSRFVVNCRTAGAAPGDPAYTTSHEVTFQTPPPAVTGLAVALDLPQHIDVSWVSAPSSNLLGYLVELWRFNEVYVDDNTKRFRELVVVAKPDANTARFTLATPTPGDYLVAVVSVDTNGNTSSARHRVTIPQ